MKFIAATGILVTCQVVFAQRFTNFRLRQPPRVCPPYQPVAFNDTTDPFACVRELAANSNVKDPDADKSIFQISIENGYSIESHNVTTSDGYILTTFRIPGGRKSPVTSGKPAVLLLHGWGNSGETWIALPNDQNLAYMLADAGYDVWLGNNRGSSFSTAHERLNPNTDLNYWEFSLQEMGFFDFPALVDQIRRISGNERIFIIGHSQGAASFLVAASEIPSVNEKIHAAYLMAPAAYLGGTYEPFLTTIFAPIFNTPLEDLLFRITRGRIQLRAPQILSSVLGIGRYDLCQPKALRCGLCDFSRFGPYYFNPAQMNYTNIPRMLSKLLDVGTLRSVTHFGQNTRSCTFRYYDHGSSRENLRTYGSATPPLFKLNQIRVPTYLLWGEQDAMVTPSDIQRLANNMPAAALRGVIRINEDSFEHQDFLIGKDANTLVNKPLVDMMDQFWNRVRFTVAK